MISLEVEIESVINSHATPIILDLTPHLIKYLKFIENAPTPGPTYLLKPIAGIAQSEVNVPLPLFQRLHKPWLMVIPKVIPFS